MPIKYCEVGNSPLHPGIVVFKIQSYADSILVVLAVDAIMSVGSESDDLSLGLIVRTIRALSQV